MAIYILIKTPVTVLINKLLLEEAFFFILLNKRWCKCKLSGFDISLLKNNLLVIVNKFSIAGYHNKQAINNTILAIFPNSIDSYSQKV